MELSSKQEYKESTTDCEAPFNRAHLKKIHQIAGNKSDQGRGRITILIADRNCKQHVPDSTDEFFNDASPPSFILDGSIGTAREHFHMYAEIGGAGR